jgi:N-acetylmuramoyl-L-alanine amidase
VTNKNIEEIAKEVIRGKYGNGKERKEALGSDYNAVQAEVNMIISQKK